MRRDHAGRGFLSLGVSCVRPRPWWASVLNGLVNTAITGQSGNGFWSLFRTRIILVLRVF